MKALAADVVHVLVPKDFLSDNPTTNNFHNNKGPKAKIQVAQVSYRRK